MSYSANDFPIPVTIFTQPQTANLSIFDTNYQAVSRHLANVANLNSGSASYDQANAAYAQANAAYAQANTGGSANTGDIIFANNIISTKFAEESIVLKSNVSDSWVATIADRSTYDTYYGSSVVIDSNNNTYIFGGDDNSANANFIVKFDSIGNEIWQKQIGDSDSRFKYSDSLHIDSSDNIYMSLNEFYGPQNNSYIVKIDTDAGIIWQTNLTGLYRNSEFSIVTDSTGNVFTVGQTDDSGEQKLLLCKFDSTGNLVFHNILNNSTIDEAGYNLTITNDSSTILVVGTIRTGVSNTSTMFVGSYAAIDGARNWEKTILGQYIDQTVSWGYAITTDEYGDAYVFGSAYQNSEGAPAILVHLDVAGNINWTKRFGDFGCQYQAYGIGIVYENNSLYVTGGMYSDASNADKIFVGKIIANTGALVWLNEFKDITGANAPFSQAWSGPDRPIAIRNNYMSIVCLSQAENGGSNWIATLLRAPTDGFGLGTAGPFGYGRSRLPYSGATLSINDITLNSVPGTLTQHVSNLTISTLDSNYTVNTYSMTTEWKFTNTSSLIFPDGSTQYTAADISDQPLNTYNIPNFSSLALTGGEGAGLIFSGNGGGLVYLNTDSNDIGIVSFSGNVLISANSQYNNEHTWNFGEDGILTMPPGNETTSGWVRWNHASNDSNNYAGAGYVDFYNVYTGMGVFSPNNSIVLGTPADQYSPFDPSTTLVFKNDSLYLPANGYIKSHTVDYSGYPTLSPNNANVHIQTSSSGNDYTWAFDYTGTLTAPGDLLPSSNNTGNIGTQALQWKSLYVSNGSIYVDGVRISSNSGSLVVDGSVTLSNNSTLNDSLGRPIVSATSGNIIDGNLVGGGASEVFGPEDLSFDGGDVETYHGAYDAAVDGGVSSTPQTILNVDGIGTTIQVRRNSSNNWIQTNLILSQGEIGFETDTGLIKIGTGSTAWNSLGYARADNVISNTQTIKLSPDDVAHPELAWSIKSGTAAPFPGGTVYEGSILMSPPSDLASIGAIGFMGAVGESGWPNDVQDTFGAAGSIGWMGNDPTFYPNIQDALWINSAKNIAVFANNNSTAGPNVRQWVFSANGEFVFPDGSTTSGSTVIANGTYDIQSLSNTIIQTSASAGAQTWTFDTTGNLTLPYGSTFNDNTNGLLVGSRAVEIKPGGGDNANQFLKIYPTVVSDGNHIHLTSGDLSVTDLFLGDDHQFVRIGTDGKVCIGTDLANNVWQFDTYGNLTFPSNNKFALVNVPATSKGQTSDIAGMIAANTSHFFYCSADYDSTSDIWKRVAWSVDTW